MIMGGVRKRKNKPIIGGWGSEIYVHDVMPIFHTGNYYAPQPRKNKNVRVIEQRGKDVNVVSDEIANDNACIVILEYR